MVFVLYFASGQNVRENSDLGTIVGQLSVDDEDSDSDVRFHVQGGGVAPFDVDLDNKLVVTGRVDYEQTPIWLLNISIEDDGQPSYRVSRGPYIARTSFRTSCLHCAVCLNSVGKVLGECIVCRSGGRRWRCGSVT